MHPILLAGVLALLWCNNVESLTAQASCTSPAIPAGFVNGAIAVSRKRPRGTTGKTAVAAAAVGSRGAVVGVVPGEVMAGSFTPAKLPAGESVWCGGNGKGRRRSSRGELIYLVFLLRS